ncbi:MAG: CxxxxCH/CxxCH domain-containing protein [Ignavibacteriaceae bacterium]|jgi:predicted CxxxxCH...CXXCH cytochrome family protein|nr:CxxxxCH/CxxCH domain-containing protein [Ignavibacteriaceae bacterium]
MIKNRFKYILAYLSIILVTFYIASCSELDPNIPPPPTVSVHPEGIDSIGSPNWHGNLVKNYNWNLVVCTDCHGPDYSGGLVNESCLTCHVLPTGPENCTTCHGSLSSNAPPKDLEGNTSTSEPGVGAHQNHLRLNKIGEPVLCSECHNVPGGLYTPGHIDTALPAEVIFNGPVGLTVTNEPNTSQYDPTLPLYEPDPTFDYTELTCSNTYCHGYFKNGNIDNEPVWNNPSTSQCGSCHGNGDNPLPRVLSQGGTHPSNDDCYICHSEVVDDRLNIIDPLKHIDGLLNLFGNDINY